MSKKENYFIIRTYGFGELAQMYLPNITRNSASRTFRKWIHNCSILETKLKFKKCSKVLTPHQVKLILTYFDLPEMYVRQFDFEIGN